MGKGKGLNINEVFKLFKSGFEGYVKNNKGERFVVSVNDGVLLRVKNYGVVIPIVPTLEIITDLYYVEDIFEEVALSDVTAFILQGEHLYFEYFELKGNVLLSQGQIKIEFEKISKLYENSKYELFVRALFNGTWKIKK